MFPSLTRGEGARLARTKDIALSKQTRKYTMPGRYAARFDAEKAALRRVYCGLFKFWRGCAHKPCRKARDCRGDAKACLKRRIEDVAYQDQWDARQKILEATPKDFGPAERTAREFLPGSFCGGP
jgi:hypothetical protein